jgi:hypothetical protein
VASAIGTKPRLATNAVISTGRTFHRAADDRFILIDAIVTPLSDRAHHDEAVEHGDARQGDEPNRRVIEKGMPRNSSANTPPASAIGTAENTIAAGTKPPSAM